MGIFSRIKEIAESNITDFKDKKFNDEKDIEEYITNLMIQLADIKESAKEVFELENKLDRQVKEYSAQSERFESLAKKAVNAGNDDDAKVFLRKKAELDRQKSESEQKYSTVHESAEKIRKNHNELVRQINDLRTRLNVLKSREAAADAQNTVNSANRSNGKVDEAFNEMETDAEIKSAKADAESYSLKDTDDEISEQLEKLKKENKK